ncbi:response regulator [Dechloromonas sp.]|uniref:ATP-binding response regulator n=1 Tax=Dechloromonas sp. TaxID=1917218 RepID=UPI0011FC25B9|nr:response regulator [Dechloromonas sp.]MBU3697070.1 response regulator [Dechloromonas sp.]TEX49434.1 MAG: response regulator receiver protein [Rhodocyclaceae bacterium]
MSNERVLVVDDEQLNLFIIEEFLEGEALQLDVQSDPLAAWDNLQSADPPFSLVILDRMMPNLDGMEFLRRMKAEPRFADIPVIMQTAASSPDQVRQGLEAGAYYYLTKPYEPEALISITRAALEDRRSRQQLISRAIRLQEAQRLISNVEYRFVTLEDVAHLVPVLAAMCPQPEVVAPGLSDLMVNAVEHGNLGVTYLEKSLLKWEGDWEGEIRRRLELPQFKGRIASVRAELSPQAIVFRITDQGDGFDWQKFMQFDPERAFDPNGRGIAMAKAMSFSNLTYQGKGNIVVATVAAS